MKSTKGLKKFGKFCKNLYKGLAKNAPKKKGNWKSRKTKSKSAKQTKSYNKKTNKIKNKKPNKKVKTGTVWDEIKATQKPLKGTIISNSFEMKAGKRKF